MKKKMVIFATAALLVTGGTTAFAASVGGEQATAGYEQQDRRGNWMAGHHRGMMGIDQEEKEAFQGMAIAERFEFMKERMNERLQANSDMTAEEREAFIQERLEEKERAFANGSMPGAGNGFGMAKGGQHCLGN